METFPGPNFFTWQSYVARVPSAPKGSLTLILPTAPVSPCAGATNHRPPAHTVMSPASPKSSVVFPNRFL